MRRTTLAALAATSLLLAGLAGCGGGDPKPKIANSAPPSPSVTVSSSPTPTAPTPPVMPAAAKKHTVAGAKAFARYFTRTVNYGAIALDPSPLKSISSDYCNSCNAAVSAIQGYIRKNATVTGGYWSLNAITVAQLRAGSNRLMRVTANGTSTRQVIRYPGGSRRVYRAGPTKDRFILIPTADGWTVDTWTVIS